MKRKLCRVIALNNVDTTIEFEYWPASYGSREQPPEPAEINITSMRYANGNVLPIPDFDTEEFEIIENLLLDLLSDESAAAQSQYDFPEENLEQ